MITPIFEDNKLAIVFSCNDNYIPYVASTILSIIKSSNLSNKYDIIILYQNLKISSKQLIYRVIGRKNNFNVRFINIVEMVAKYHLKGHIHISAEAYYRLLVPHILEGYDRAVHLDGDLIVLEDIIDLIKIDLHRCLLGARQSIPWVIEGGREKQNLEYLYETVKFSSVYKIFNVGVLIFDLTCVDRYINYEILLDDINNNFYSCGDEDIINKYYQNSTYFIPLKFNLCNYVIDLVKLEKFGTYSMYKEFIEAYKNPKIIHYQSWRKPWHYPNINMGYYYWNTIRDTELYDLVLQSQSVNIQKNYLGKIIQEVC
ncbi:MAG: hypothetical protein BEN19_00210 [Epulopiscium sp. Nuni2H_MBin003]|nr:MAG: hypothetical protein BEN19_00210 [Epulopiscium sp. Nuni2H_MBin003]